MVRPHQELTPKQVLFEQLHEIHDCQKFIPHHTVVDLCLAVPFTTFAMTRSSLVWIRASTAPMEWLLASVSSTYISSSVGMAILVNWPLLPSVFRSLTGMLVTTETERPCQSTYAMAPLSKLSLYEAPILATKAHERPHITKTDRHRPGHHGFHIDRVHRNVLSQYHMSQERKDRWKILHFVSV